MDLTELVTMLAGKFPLMGLVLGVLGALVIAGQAIVVLTPTKADDEAWDKIKSLPIIGQLISIVANFAPVQKK